MVDASSTFDAFADPTRREILLVLSEGEMTAGELADRIDHVGRTAVSSHLRVLRLAGLVTERREGRFRYYSVDPAPASELVDFISSVYRSVLTDLGVASRDQRAIGKPSISA
jgi:DNA-binding transcriptional ArsR family regulator